MEIIQGAKKEQIYIQMLKNAKKKYYGIWYILFKGILAHIIALHKYF